jgi:hypothetical protein
MLSHNTFASCYSLDECFDVKSNNYTISIKGYTVWAEGTHLPSNKQWRLSLIKQYDVGFVTGITLGDDTHWEERIEIEYDPKRVIDPKEFSKLITRVCENGSCRNAEQ